MARILFFPEAAHQRPAVFRKKADHNTFAQCRKTLSDLGYQVESHGRKEFEVGPEGPHAGVWVLSKETVK